MCRWRATAIGARCFMGHTSVTIMTTAVGDVEAVLAPIAAKRPLNDSLISGWQQEQKVRN